MLHISSNINFVNVVDGENKLLQGTEVQQTRDQNTFSCFDEHIRICWINQ